MPNGRITLARLVWMIPHVIPALEYKCSLMKHTENKIKVPVAFRAMRSNILAVP